MATKDKLRNDIKKLKEFLAKPSTPASAKDKIKAQIKKIENELSAKKPTKTVATTVATTKVMLGKLQKFVKKNPKYGGYSGTSESNLKKDAVRNALKIGRRTSEGKRSNQYGSKSDNKGNVYYEYRSNRLDVKQPRAKQKFPILEDGGEIASMSEKDFINKYFGANVFTEDVSKYFDIKTISSSNDAKIEKFIEDYKRDGYTIKKKSYSDFKSVMAVKKKMADGGYMAGGGKLDAGVYRVGKPKKVSPNLYEQKIVEIFDNGSISTASDYGRSLSDFKSQKYPIISSEQLEEQYKMADGGYMADGGEVKFDKNGNKLMYFEPINQRHDVVAYINDSSKIVSPSGVYYLPHPIAKEVVKWSKKNGYQFMQDDKIYYDGGMMADGGDTDGKYGYIAFYKGKRAEVYANTSYEAQLKAAKMFNAKKSYDVHVVLAEKDGVPVTHSTSSMAMGGVTEHGLMVGDYILRISGSEKRMTVQNGKQLFHVNITTGERKKYMEDGGAINVLGDTAGADLQSVGGTMYSSADLTDHLTIENTGFFKGGGVLSKTHRRNS